MVPTSTVSEFYGYLSTQVGGDSVFKELSDFFSNVYIWLLAINSKRNGFNYVEQRMLAFTLLVKICELMSSVFWAGEAAFLDCLLFS